MTLVAGPVLWLLSCMVVAAPSSLLPCVPYAASDPEVSRQSSPLPTQLALLPTLQGWSADFSIKSGTKEQKLRLYRDHEDQQVQVQVGDAHNMHKETLQQALSSAIWIVFSVTLANATQIQVKIDYGNQSLPIKTDLNVDCTEAEITTLQLTSVKVVWECRRDCIAQQEPPSMQLNTHTNNTFFIKPEKDFEITFELEIKNCVGKYEPVAQTHTNSEIEMMEEIWNVLIIESSSVLRQSKFYYGYNLYINDHKKTFPSSKQIYQICGSFVNKLQLKSAKSALWGSPKCSQEDYFPKNKEAGKTPCPNPLTTNHSPKLPATPATSEPQSSAMLVVWLSTLLVLVLVILVLAIVALVLTLQYTN